MFLCTKCAETSLNERGKEWPWPKSYGPCEFCKTVDTCKDVPSGADWAWKS